MKRILLAAAGIMMLAYCAGSPAAPQPVTAQSVAAQLHLTGFTGCGPVPTGGVYDSGTAYQGSMRVGINTYSSPSVRDDWELAAGYMGVIPFAYGPQWVAYKAVNQHVTGCG